MLDAIFYMLNFCGFLFGQVFQVRVSLVKDAKKQEQMWERQHELAADKIYNMCYDLGGFFLKVFYFSIALFY